MKNTVSRGRDSTRTGELRDGRWLVLFAALAWHALAVAAVGIGTVAPDWTLDTSAGDEIRFYEHAGDRPAVMVFWATWCPYCRALLPHLEALRAEFDTRGVRFYALNVWEDGDAVAYFREHDYSMPLMLTADLVAEQYGIRGTPGVVVTDGSHRVTWVRNSGTPAETVETTIRALLERELRAAAND